MQKSCKILMGNFILQRYFKRNSIMDYLLIKEDAEDEVNL
jgi:hypothetical protein